MRLNSTANLTCPRSFPYSQISLKCSGFHYNTQPLVAALPAVVGTADHSHGRAAIRVDRPISLVYVSRVMSCLSIYTRPSLHAPQEQSGEAL